MLIYHRLQVASFSLLYTSAPVLIRILWAGASHSNVHFHVCFLCGLQRAVLEGTSLGKAVYTRSVLCSWHRGYKQPTLWSPRSSPSLGGCLVHDFTATSHWDSCFLNLREREELGSSDKYSAAHVPHRHHTVYSKILQIPLCWVYVSQSSAEILHVAPQITVLVTSVSHVVWHSSLALQVEPRINTPEELSQSILGRAHLSLWKHHSLLALLLTWPKKFVLRKADGLE